MDLGIKGRKALLTGASRGIGRACAFALAQEGVDLTICARDPDKLEETATEIRKTAEDVTVHCVAADVTTEEGRGDIISACPNPDILLNNAGGMLPGDFREWSRETWIEAVDLMMLPPIMLMRALVDGMMERKWGRIVNIVSRSVKIPQPELGLSNGARSGLVGFTAGLARQTVEQGVTINNLLPGTIDTEAQRDHIKGLLSPGGPSYDELRAQRMAGNPAKRFGQPEEVGAYFAFLCSEKASFITGQNLLIDGGSYPGTY